MKKQKLIIFRVRQISNLGNLSVSRINSRKQILHYKLLYTFMQDLEIDISNLFLNSECQLLATAAFEAIWWLDVHDHYDADGYDKCDEKTD